MATIFEQLIKSGDIVVFDGKVQIQPSHYTMPESVKEKLVSLRIQMEERKGE